MKVLVGNGTIAAYDDPDADVQDCPRCDGECYDEDDEPCGYCGGMGFV